jgi:hypothetical protein
MRRESTQDGRTLAVNGEGIDGCGRACSVDVAESLISVPTAYQHQAENCAGPRTSSARVPKVKPDFLNCEPY